MQTSHLLPELGLQAALVTTEFPLTHSKLVCGAFQRSLPVSLQGLDVQALLVQQVLDLLLEGLHCQPQGERNAGSRVVQQRLTTGLEG